MSQQPTSRCDRATRREAKGGLDESDQNKNNAGMETPSPFALASMLLTAPAWARVGISAPSKRVREAAAMELATVIVERLDAPPAIAIEGQLALPL